MRSRSIPTGIEDLAGRPLLGRLFVLALDGPAGSICLVGT